MVQEGGSDLLVAAGFHPSFRKHGGLEVFKDRPKYSVAEVQNILKDLLTDQEISTLKKQKDLDFAVQINLGNLGQCRFRGNAFFQKSGPSVVLRSIPREIPSLEELGLPVDIGQGLMEWHQGLVLVTGPTGAGKTSTLAALTDYANSTRPQNIITLEDPIEFVHRPKKSLVVQRQVGMHTDSYASALRAALREDPDIILVGELRDEETISLSMTAAETGHLVISTMNTISAAQTINRIVNAFPPRQQSQIRTMLADSLRGVISQQLLRNKDGKGRSVAVEIMLGTQGVANLIRENKMHQVNSVIQTSTKKGMRMMDDSLLELVQKGLVDPQEAIDRAHDKNNFIERVKMVGGSAR
ncbi:MAG: PilT/PilU family type 4a pilus ATPase [Candidatus Eremiobacteraeota bacterium]|nr:PilT/PilU family type 4a pilus ATPase [Candidatus Eremiobacteraeota bacterium]